MSESKPQSARGAHLLQKAIAVIVLLVVAGCGWWYLEHSESNSAAGEAHRDAGPPPKVPVRTLAPQRVAFAPTVLGQAEPFQVVQIRSRVAGFLKHQTFTEGGRVNADQPLFEIDPRSFEADVREAEANLNSARATLKRAQAQLKRYEQLAETQAATASELEEWQTEAGVASANVQLAEARLDQARLDLSYTHIESPIDGYIGMTDKDVGSYVDAGSNSLLATVRQIDPIHIRYTVSEKELLTWQRRLDSGRLQIDDPNRIMVRLTLADGTDYDKPGVIDFVDTMIDPSDGTAVIRATVPNPDGRLRPGQFVQVTPLGVTLNDTLLVPQRAVLQNPTGSSVYVIDDKNVAQMRMISVDQWEGDQWVVTDGLQAGDRVVADGIAKVRPNAPVEPVGETTTDQLSTTTDR